MFLSQKLELGAKEHLSQLDTERIQAANRENELATQINVLEGEAAEATRVAEEAKQARAAADARLAQLSAELKTRIEESDSRLTKERSEATRKLTEMAEAKVAFGVELEEAQRTVEAATRRAGAFEEEMDALRAKVDSGEEKATEVRERVTIPENRFFCQAS